MSATPGNQFWKLRTKHGRDKLFSSPESLWDACKEYFESVDNNPIKEGDKKLRRPYTLTGLYVFLDIDRQTWANYRSQEQYKDFFAICKTVENIMYTQKFEGATVGTFNHNIIARDLGLTDKKDVTQNIDLRANTAKLFPDEDDPSWNED